MLNKLPQQARMWIPLHRHQQPRRHQRVAVMDLYERSNAKLGAIKATLLELGEEGGNSDAMLKDARAQQKHADKALLVLREEAGTKHPVDDQIDAKIAALAG